MKENNESNIQLTKTLGIKEAGYSEPWLQNQINKNPSMLGLGDLEVLKKEKIQSTRGRIDFLLINVDETKMYEVEIQLEETNPDHIIRVLEYWNREKRRYPHKEHFPVLVAEKINNRFFNVIHMLSLNVPIIAIQMNLLDVNGQHALHVTKILDEYEEQELEYEHGEDKASEDYWMRKSAWTLNNARFFNEIIQKIYKTSSINIVQSYISIQKDDRNRFTFGKHPEDYSKMYFWINEKYIDEINNILENVEIPYKKQRKAGNDFEYQMKINKKWMENNKDIIIKIAEIVNKTYE